MSKKTYSLSDTQHKYICPFHDKDGNIILIGDTISYQNDRDEEVLVRVIGMTISVNRSIKNLDEVIASRYLKVRNLQTNKIYCISKCEDVRICNGN